GHGSLTVEVGNTGEVLSEYSVSVTKCTTGLHDIAAKTLSLNPGEVKNTSFTLRSGDTDGGDKKCEVQLYDSNFNLLDTAMIDIKVGAACMCFGICGCVCEDDENVKSTAHCSEAGPPT
ncbi:Hapless 2, partial [Geodia barretti]